MSRATKRALGVGLCSISWPLNPSEGGLQPHLRSLPTFVNVSLYSGRPKARLVVDSGAPGKSRIKVVKGPTTAFAANRLFELWP